VNKKGRSVDSRPRTKFGERRPIPEIAMRELAAVGELRPVNSAGPQTDDVDAEALGHKPSGDLKADPIGPAGDHRRPAAVFGEEVLLGKEKGQ
jgi:hypothetical protein